MRAPRSIRGHIDPGRRVFHRTDEADEFGRRVGDRINALVAGGDQHFHQRAEAMPWHQRGIGIGNRIAEHGVERHAPDQVGVGVQAGGIGGKAAAQFRQARFACQQTFGTDGEIDIAVHRGVIGPLAFDFPAQILEALHRATPLT